MSVWDQGITGHSVNVCVIDDGELVGWVLAIWNVTIMWLSRDYHVTVMWRDWCLTGISITYCRLDLSYTICINVYVCSVCIAYNYVACVPAGVDRNNKDISTNFVSWFAATVTTMVYINYSALILDSTHSHTVYCKIFVTNNFREFREWSNLRKFLSRIFYAYNTYGIFGASLSEPLPLRVVRWLCLFLSYVRLGHGGSFGVIY